MGNQSALISDNAKAWVALIMAALGVVTVVFGFDMSSITEDTLLAIIAALTPILVWSVPNGTRSG
jgi:purine-cytosine permease-like protein